MEFNPSLFYERLARWILSVLILAILPSMTGAMAFLILALCIMRIFAVKYSHSIKYL